MVILRSSLVKIGGLMPKDDLSGRYLKDKTVQEPGGSV